MPNPPTNTDFWGTEDSKFSGLTDEIGQELASYLSFRQGTHWSYSASDDHLHASKDTVAKSTQYVQHDMPTDVLRTRDDHQSILELATREWTGYGASQDRDSALERWTLLATSAPDVPRRIKAKAYSCLAAAWFDRATEDAERWNIDSLYRAGDNANEAVSLGLVSPGALRTGFSIETHGFRRPEDNRFPGLSTDRFEQLNHLWDAIDMRTEEMSRASAKKDTKVVRVPLKYICSAEDCGIQATKKSGLFRCAGKCPVVFKPSYCSKECQKMDWKRHKPFCKADATRSSVDYLNVDHDAGETTAQRAALPDGATSDRIEGRSSGHSADAPTKNGSTARHNSKTLGTKTMKELRKIAEDNQNR